MAIPQTVAESAPPGQAKGKSASEMWHYRRLVARAVYAFGDEIKASRWLSSPNVDLGNQTPISVAQKSGYDSRALEPVFLRIEHGIDH